MEGLLNEVELRKAITVMKPDNQLFEVRVIYGNKVTYSGYFRNADTLVKAIKSLDKRDCNVYLTLNELNDACYSRSQRDRFEKNPKATTSDNDVTAYEWILIDLDPKRPTGTSSSDEQIAAAKKKGNEIYMFLRDVGFEKPLFGFSGNGVHLLYRVKLHAVKENTELIKNCLLALNMLFTDEQIDVDTKNFNPARVCKLYGTIAQKGSDTKERPHRMSHIVGEVGELKITSRKYLEKLATLLPKQETPQRYNNYRPIDFDLDDWLSKYSINYRKTGYSDGTKYILDCCPFDSNHKGKDACIFKRGNGAIAFHCFHNSCADKTWRDVRILFEPDAYERRQMEYEQRIYSRPAKKEPPKIEQRADIPYFMSAADILNLPQEDERFVKTGIKTIDSKMRGLKNGYVSLMSGLRASGKSSVISEITLDAVQAGNNVGVFSGELAPKNFMRWMNLQAAGKGFAEPTQFEGYYNVPRGYQKKIASWLGDHFWLYNNEYGNHFSAIMQMFEKQIDEKKLDLLILDNLMAFNISDLSDSKWDAQSAFVLDLHKLAVKKNIHILFVAHPRKAQGFLRLDDISGSADLANAVDNAFIVHRVNEDFRRLSAQMFRWKDSDPIYEATNVIEIAKDRAGGIQDEFIPLYYETESKRLKNEPNENKIYGWRTDEQPIPQPVKDDFVKVTDDMENIPW